MNVSVISHMCAGTQKRFNKKIIQKLESMRFYRNVQNLHIGLLPL